MTRAADRRRPASRMVSVAGALVVLSAPAPAASAPVPAAPAPIPASAAAPASSDLDPALAVVPSETSLTQGQSAETLVRIVLSGPGPAVVAPPRLFVSTGRIEEARREGDRSFVALYHAPEIRFPEVAIVAAEVQRPLVRGFATIALRAPARPTFRTLPGARVTVRVGRDEFGPVTADSAGQAQIPIVVSPGVATAHVRSLGAKGQVTEREVALKPPRFQQLLLLAPSALPAGLVVELGLVGIAADGSPIDDSRLVLRSSYLRPHPLGSRAHVARYLVRVPPRIESGPLQLVARLRGEETEGEEPDDLSVLPTSLPLCPGPLARLTLAPRRSRLTVSGGDLWGHPVAIDNVEIYVNGRPAHLDRQGSEPAVVMFDPAHPLVRGPVEVEAVLDGIYTSYHLGFEPAERPSQKAVPARESFGVGAAIGPLWASGPGYGLAARIDVEAPSSYLPAPLRVGLGVGYLGTRASAGDDLGRSHVAIDQVLLLARLRWQWRVDAGFEPALAAGVGMAYTQVRNEVYQLRLVDRQAGAAAEVAAEVAGPAGPGSLALGLRYLRAPVGTLPSGDMLEGGGGGLVFDLGYRVRF